MASKKQLKQQSAGQTPKRPRGNLQVKITFDRGTLSRMDTYKNDHSMLSIGDVTRVAVGHFLKNQGY